MNNILKNQKIKDGSFIGSTDLSDVTANELSVMGPLKFSNLTVVGDSDILGSIRESQNGTFNELSVLGVLEAENVTCRMLDVAGSVKVKGLNVNGDTNISGSLEIKAASDPEFPNKLQNLDVSAEVITLEDTVVNGDITIQPTLKNKALKLFKQGTTQSLHLAGKTIVNGNITFVSGKGKIKQSSLSTVKGQIIGGTIENN
jgi:hypothetical protein